jgi:hypothetical protein
MQWRLFYGFVILVLLLQSCRQQKTKVANKNNSNITVYPSAPEPDYNRDSLEKIDNEKLDALLKTILKDAALRIKEDSFSVTLAIDTTSSNTIKANYSFGRLFANNQRHLLIRRLLGNGFSERRVYTNVYAIKQNKFVRAMNDTIEDGYAGDTLRDVNGDGFKDLLIHSYSSCGSAMRNAINGYIYLPKTGYFTRCFDFFNPQFYPDKKLYYEIGYGHPPYLNLSKYKWIHNRAILVESLEYANTFYENKIKNSLQLSRNDKSKPIRLKDVPIEYKNLNYFNYFIEGMEDL